MSEPTCPCSEPRTSLPVATSSFREVHNIDPNRITFQRERDVMRSAAAHQRALYLDKCAPGQAKLDYASSKTIRDGSLR